MLIVVKARAEHVSDALSVTFPCLNLALNITPLYKNFKFLGTDKKMVSMNNKHENHTVISKLHIYSTKRRCHLPVMISRGRIHLHVHFAKQMYYLI